MKSFILILFTFLGFSKALSQEQNSVITTAVPFLNIASDARSSGMGDVGVATAPDAFSMQWNASKYVFSDKKSGIGLGYTPYLESIISDIALLSGYYLKNQRTARLFL